MISDFEMISERHFSHMYIMLFLGEPHIDGEPGDLRFKIKQQK